MRPNIRIEIQNDNVEPMDVEEQEEDEEGELQDSDNEQIANKSNTNIKTTELPSNQLSESKKQPSFITGINILDKREQEKLQERAKRFQLKPDEINNFTDDDLQKLYNSLGINKRNELIVKFNTIHMYGIDGMLTEDILDYFLKYAPLSIEWIDTNCCTVVWPDQISPVRALYFMSKAVRGMPVRDDYQNYFETSTTTAILQEADDSINQSVLLINKNREIELQQDDATIMNQQLDIGDDCADISEINGNIPPGYWRVGQKHNKSKCILLRFGLKNDQQPFKTEQFSWYYKKQKTHQKSQGIFSRNKEMIDGSSKSDNPWSVLAKNWDEDSQFREREPLNYADINERIEIKNPSLRTRLGYKRKDTQLDDVDVDKKKIDDNGDDADDGGGVGEINEPTKKSKIPRMRMYADEEEEKIKRKKMLQSIKNQYEKISTDQTTDLRRILVGNRKIVKKQPIDLGPTLKNRNKKMVFQLKSDEVHNDDDDDDDDNLETTTKRKQRFEHKLPERRQLRKDQHYNRNLKDHNKDDVVDDDDDDDDSDNDRRNKPKSKVAVVIKTQKKPTVASTVWSRINRHKNDDNSDSDNDDDDDDDGVDTVYSKDPNRPGFDLHVKDVKLDKNPLKIEINNDHYSKNV